MRLSRFVPLLALAFAAACAGEPTSPLAAPADALRNETAADTIPPGSGPTGGSAPTAGPPPAPAPATPPNKGSTIPVV